MKNKGKSIEDAINVNAEYSEEGIALEYEWIDKVWGIRDIDWTLINQELLHHGGKHFDILYIEFPNKETRVIYFDISKFYGKYKLFS